MRTPIATYNGAADQYKLLLKVFKDSTTNEIKVREKRTAIINQKAPKRIMSTAKSFNKGVYSSPKAVKQIARDLLGYPSKWF